MIWIFWDMNRWYWVTKDKTRANMMVFIINDKNIYLLGVGIKILVD